MKENQDKWEVIYLGWKEFSKGIISREGQVWDLLIQADLVIGGINFTSNFL
jgi:hypothetical protein